MTPRLALLSVLCPALLAWSLPAAAAKTDVVTLNNGDRITGEVKQLDRGLLRYSTDSMSTIFIEWQDVARLESNQRHRVELRDGRRHFGAFGTRHAAGRIAVLTDAGPEEMEMMDVVRITPVEQSLRQRLDGSVGAGYDFTKSSDVSRINASAKLSYADEYSKTTLDWRTVVTDDGDKTTNATRGTLERRRWRMNRYYTFAAASAESNDELGLDLRTLVGGGIGRHFVQTNRRQLAGSTGLAVAYTERSDGGSDAELYGVLGLEWAEYRFNTPALDVTTVLAILPALTSPGDYLGRYDLEFAWELVADVDWTTSFYADYDSDTPSDDSSVDYGVITGLAWEFW